MWWQRPSSLEREPTCPTKQLLLIAFDVDFFLFCFRMAANKRWSQTYTICQVFRSETASLCFFFPPSYLSLSNSPLHLHTFSPNRHENGEAINNCKETHAEKHTFHTPSAHTSLPFPLLFSSVSSMADLDCEKWANRKTWLQQNKNAF